MLKVMDFQRAIDELNKELNKFRGGKHVTVGIHEAAGNVESGEITMAQLGAIQEFGTMDGHIPARPWLVPGVEGATQDLIDTIRNGVAAGENVDAVLNRMGIVAQGAVQQYITDLRTPPNAPSTIAQKGSDNPLIDNGAMRASVTYVVQSGNRPTEEGL